MKKIINYLILAFLFLVPWQTRWIWHYGQINGGAWEYGTFAYYATEILLWLIVILFAVHAFGHKEFWRTITAKEYFHAHKKRLYAGLAFILFLGLEIANSASGRISLNFILHLLEAVCIFIVFLAFADKKKMLAALWLGGAAQGVLATAQFFSQTVSASKWLGMAEQYPWQGGASVIEFGGQRWLRAYGAFGSPNSLGIYLAVLLVLGLMLYIKEANPKLRILLTAGQLCILSGLILSFSRASWLAAAVGLVSAKIIIYCKDRKNIFEIAKQFVFYLLISIFFLVILYPVFLARFNLSNRLEKQSVSERTAQIGEAMGLLNYQNLFLGVGPGAFTFAVYKSNPNLSYWLYQPVHDIYVLILVEWGLLGAILFLFIHAKLLQFICKTNIIFLPVILTLLAAGIFDHWLWSMYAGLVFWWVIFGFGVNLGKADIDS